MPIATPSDAQEQAIVDTIETATFPILDAPVLRASHIPVLPNQNGQTTRQEHAISTRELAFVVTTGLLGLGVLLLVGAACFWFWRRRNGRRRDGLELGCAAREFDGSSTSSWGTVGGDSKRLELAITPFTQEFKLAPARNRNPPLEDSDEPQNEVECKAPPLGSAFASIIEEFELRLQQEEQDIASALVTASASVRCMPFFGGGATEDDLATMLALQAGMECVGKRSMGVRNRARHDSDASASTQQTDVSVEGFANSAASSMTSIGTGLSEIEEEVVVYEVYEVKRARAESVEVGKGRLVSWGPAMLVPEASTSTISINLDLFPVPPV